MNKDDLIVTIINKVDCKVDGLDKKFDDLHNKISEFPCIVNSTKIISLEKEIAKIKKAKTTKIAMVMGLPSIILAVLNIFLLIKKF